MGAVIVYTGSDKREVTRPEAEIEVKRSGSGKLVVFAPEVTNLRVIRSGSGNAFISAPQARTATLDNYGSGKIYVELPEECTAKCSRTGSGDIDLNRFSEDDHRKGTVPKSFWL